MKEILTIQRIDFVQFDRNQNKTVYYDKDLDEGVWMRYVISVDVNNIPIIINDENEDHRAIGAYQDLSISWFEEEFKHKREELIQNFSDNVIRNIWEFISSHYDYLTNEDYEKFKDYMKHSGEIIYKHLKSFWENTDEDTKNDIREKNKVKVQTTEICLNDILKEG